PRQRAAGRDRKGLQSAGAHRSERAFRLRIGPRPGVSSDLWKTGHLGKAGQPPYNPPNPLQRSGMRILFITANRLGDAILSTGLLHELHLRFPKARFTVACGPAAAGIFEAMPNLERVIVMQKLPWAKHWW